VLDELQLFVYPIVLGGGKRLFDGDLPEIPLKLVDAQTFSKGVLHLNYQPATA
jgi:dihydrofolate reductase